MPVIDRFEDGDVAEWDSSSNFSATTDALAGSYSGKWNADANTAFQSINSPTLTDDGYTVLSFTIRADKHTSDTTLQIPINDDAGGELGELQHRGSGDVVWRDESDGSTTTIGSYSTDTTYDYTVTFDYANNTATVDRDGTQLGSGLGIASPSGNGYVGISLEYDGGSGTSGTDAEYRVDNIEAPTDPPAAPDNVSASYIADDQIDVSWDKDSSGGTVEGYEIEINRDGYGFIDPAGGPATVTDDGSSSYTKSYGPNSDNPYDTQVGIDSSFVFQVRQFNTANDGTTQYSSWVQSGTVYTSPIPPHKPNADRPGPNSITLNWTTQSDIVSSVQYQERVDTGAGYGSWSASTTVASGDTLTLSQDRRYQFRLRSVGPNGKTSPWVYLDYGNRDNVFFTDDFEDNDLAEWTSTTLNDADSGVTDTSGPADLNISSADEGTYWLRLDAGDTVTKDLGDLSGESNVLVRLALAVGSMDTSSETVGVEWYDGSSWVGLAKRGYVFNRQGWAELHAVVPSSDLSTDNRIRLTGYGGGGDYAGFDRLVVSDILNEYTEPASVTNFQIDRATEREITASWNQNTSFPGYAVQDINIHTSPDDADNDRTFSVSSPYTLTNLLDGEQYDVYVRNVFPQYRRGSISSYWVVSTPEVTATTRQPPDTGLSASGVTADSLDLSWTDESNNETGRKVFRTREQEHYLDFTANADEYYQASDDALLQPKFDSFTISWVVRGDFGTSSAPLPELVQKRSSESSSFVYRGRNDFPDSYIRIDSESTNRALDYSSDQSFSTATRFTVVVDGANGDGRVYRDSTLKQSSTPPNEEYRLDQGIVFGDRNGANAAMDLFEVEWWGRALTDSEAKNLDSTIPINDLYGYWPLRRDGVPTTDQTPDMSGYGHHATVATNQPTLQGSYTQAASPGVDATAYSDTGLLNGEEYRYFVESLTDHTRAGDL